jgi:hypothetical protein
MVEAPGTAPGSERFIATAVYRHSRLVTGTLNIGVKDLQKKSREAALNCLRRSSLNLIGIR